MSEQASAMGAERSWVTRVRDGVWVLALLALGWPLLRWAVWRAQVQPDPAACERLQHHGACWGVVAANASAWLWGTPEAPFAWSKLQGLPLTLALFIAALGLSLPLGVAMAVARQQRRWPLLRTAVAAYVEGMRAVPLITWIFAAAYMWPQGLGQAPALIWRAGLILSLFSAAYLTEIVRSGLRAVPQEQWDAARSLGARRMRVMRSVALPQAFRTMLPALTAHAIGLLKDTSLVTIVGLHELSGSTGLSLAGDPRWRPYTLEADLFIAAVYLLLTSALHLMGQRLQARWTRPS